MATPKMHFIAAEVRGEPRINPGNRKHRFGYMTLTDCKGVEIALYHPTRSGLEHAFNAVTDGRIPFDRRMVSRVEIRNQREVAR